jgi:hypothetical protein
MPIDPINCLIPDSQQVPEKQQYAAALFNLNVHNTVDLSDRPLPLIDVLANTSHKATLPYSILSSDGDESVGKKQVHLASDT